MLSRRLASCTSVHSINATALRTSPALPALPAPPTVSVAGTWAAGPLRLTSATAPHLTARVAHAGGFSRFNTQRRTYASSTSGGDACAAGPGSTQIPDFSAYRKPTSNDAATTSRAFTYFMVGTTGALTAAGVKSTVHQFLTNMSASADVLALAKVEVDLAAIPEGKNVVVKWRGKPVFIRHRTPEEIKEAESVTIAELRDPQTDAERVKQPEWLVMLGICTHLGCVPIGEAGDFDGWFCPCHGSHYDISGRIRKGPAPLNLEVPEYDIQGSTLVIG